MAVMLASCAARPRPGPDLSDPALAAEAYAAFLPARLVIHPLTRLTVNADGGTALLAHIEFRDRFDLHTRALGVLRIALQRPGVDPIMSSADPTDTTPGEAAWVVDLSDPERNASLYDDLITRTYTLTLASPPQWVLDWAADVGEARVGAGSGAPTIAAAFTFHDPGSPAGSARTLTDTARLLR
jgi:hypothetical protein